MDIGIVKPVRIDEEMKGAYLDYAMSVITARALPDVRDGLKPVQRRILYSMEELGLRHTAAYKKSARIVGEVMGKYHPHGDAPVYEAMVRMAQDFSMRYQLVDGQGNFGSVDGDPPAAMRYTEARLESIAEEMLADIDKNTVDFSPNFDDTLREPKVLPAKVPNLLVNGSAGIAVGMATNIPPHNLTEVASAAVYIIERFGDALDGGVPFPLVWGRAFSAPVDLEQVGKAVPHLKPALKQRVEAAAGKGGAGSNELRAQALLGIVDDLIDVPPDKLMEIVKGPDFPTAGIILGVEGIKNAYATGHGRVTIRARAHTEDMRGGRTQIVVTELPFQVNKATLQEKIAELVKERRIEGISELRDESDRQGMRLVIELRRDAQTKQILNHLYKYTGMQTAFSVNMLALVDGQPRVLTLKMALLHYLNHRREVITRRTEFDLARARQRAHILEGLKIALDNLDEVIATIRRSKDAETARTALMKGFKLTEIQAQAILDMQLRRLAALERQKIRDELAQTLKLIAHLEDLLAHPTKILYLIKDELVELKTKYGDERRTRIVAEEVADFSEEDLIPDQEVVVGVTGKGYARRALADGFRMQRRGTKGIVGTIAKEDDPAVILAQASTRDSLLLFSNRGRAYQMRVNDVPDASRQARGLPIGNLVGLEEQEQVVVLLPMRHLEGRFVVLATRRGEVKRVSASEYGGARATGIIGIAVPEGDELLSAVVTSGRQEVMLATANGQAIRFAETDLRPSGRNSGGVRGIKLGDNDRVVSLDVVRSDGDFVVVTSRGFGKRTPIHEFSAQGRGGGGIKAAAIGVKNGEVVAGRVAAEADEVIVVTSGGTVVRSPVSAVQRGGRAVLGVPIVMLGKDEKVVSAAVLRAPDKTSGGKQGPPIAPEAPEVTLNPGTDNGNQRPIRPPKGGRGPSGANDQRAPSATGTGAKEAAGRPVKKDGRSKGALPVAAVAGKAADASITKRTAKALAGSGGTTLGETRVQATASWQEAASSSPEKKATVQPAAPTAKAGKSVSSAPTPNRPASSRTEVDRPIVAGTPTLVSKKSSRALATRQDEPSGSKAVVPPPMVAATAPKPAAQPKASTPGAQGPAPRVAEVDGTNRAKTAAEAFKQGDQKSISKAGWVTSPSARAGDTLAQQVPSAKVPRKAVSAGSEQAGGKSAKPLAAKPNGKKVAKPVTLFGSIAKTLTGGLKKATTGDGTKGAKAVAKGKDHAKVSRDKQQGLLL